MLPTSAWSWSESGPFCAQSVPPVSDGTSPRLRVERIDGAKVLVLVPPGYQASTRRYPVLYFMHGGVTTVDCVLRMTDLIAFTARQPPGRQAIVVMPDGSAAPLWVNWRNGQYAYETLFTNKIVPTIDARYRTRRGRAYRGVTGFSGGGGGAMHLTGHHPDLFAAAGAFSGVVYLDENDAVLNTFVLALGVGITTTDGKTPDPVAVFGDPATQAVWWHNANPGDLAPNMRGVSLRFRAGNGTPCDARDAQELATFAPFGQLELWVHGLARRFDAALDRHGVSHTYDDYGCGLHTYRYVQRGIHLWWPWMFRAFGRPPPRSFDHYRVDPNFSVWGWSFKADPRRAAEFLYITRASRSGLTLRGSGTETVTTPRLLRSRQGVQVTGTGFGAKTLTATSAGRLTFTVNLGPPHRQQQYTAAQRLQEAQGGYWTTRTVRFKPLRPASRRRPARNQRPRFTG